ncbi:MAG: hypothetical protein P4L84_18635 [Isosphaeraceae bacterium]|nr:hypothetical protein [Isosphaeraceae bacterium]
MHRGRALFVVVGLIFAACPVRTPAQPPSGGGDSASPLLISMAPAVQEELKLSTDQKTKVYDLVRSMSLKQRELNQSIMFSGGGVSPQAVFQARDGLRREMEQSLGQIFDKKQNARFLQIMLRAEGPLAVARPEVASRLGLTESQSNQVRVIAIQLQQAQRQLFMSLRMNGVAAGGPGFNRDAVVQFTAASNKLRKEAIQQIGRVLKSKQRDDFDKMLGEPFDLAKLQSSDSSTPVETAKAEPATKDKDASSTSSDDDSMPEEKTKSAAKKKTRKGR